jgi:hypothetical protein
VLTTRVEKRRDADAHPEPEVERCSALHRGERPISAREWRIGGKNFRGDFSAQFLHLSAIFFSSLLAVFDEAGRGFVVDVRAARVRFDRSRA